MLKRNKLQSLPHKIMNVNMRPELKETIKETLPKLHFLSKEIKSKNETSVQNQDDFLKVK